MKPCKNITPNIPVNVNIAKGQNEYQTLYAHRVPGPYGAMCFAVELSDKEIRQLKKSKRLFINVLTFNNPMQPLYITPYSKEAEQIVVSYYKEATKNAD